MAIAFTTRTCLDRRVPCLYLTSITPRPPARPFSYLTDCSGQPTTCTCTATCDLLEETMCDSQLDGNALCGFDYETRSKWVKNETVNGVQTMHYHYGDPLGQVTTDPPTPAPPPASAPMTPRIFLTVNITDPLWLTRLSALREMKRSTNGLSSRCSVASYLISCLSFMLTMTRV